jgi:hypothetical protein
MTYGLVASHPGTLAPRQVFGVGKGLASLREVCIVPEYYHLLLIKLPRYGKHLKMAGLVRRVFCPYYEL